MCQCTLAVDSSSNVSVHKGRSGEEEFAYPEGVAVDNTTGTLYVCDYWNDHINFCNAFILYGLINSCDIMHNLHLWLLMSERFVHKILIVYVPEQEEHVEEKLLQSTHILGACCVHTNTHTA